MKISIKNFSAQNTPVIIQRIGNLLLLLAVMGGCVLLFHVQNTGIIIPPIVIQVATWMSALGGTGKILSKFAGVSKPDEILDLIEKSKIPPVAVSKGSNTDDTNTDK